MGRMREEDDWGKSFMGAKGQIVSLDLLIALSIFAFLLVTLFSVINSNNANFFQNSEYNEMALQALEISEILIKTPGKPSNWDSSNVIAFGLASEDRIISFEKAQEFCSIPESDISRLLNIDYPFYFNLSGAVTCGSVPSGARAATIERIVFFNGSNSKLRFTLWR